MNAIANIKARIRLQQWAQQVSFEQLQVQSSVGSSRAAVIIHLLNTVLEVEPGTDQRTLETVLLALKSTC